MANTFTHNTTDVHIGDTVRIHQSITDGDKTRTQLFEGLVIAIKNAGAGQSFTVRKIGANGIGVEKILPVRLPSIKSIEVKRKGHVRRAKLYYLRDRSGKAATRIKEKSAVAQTTKSA